MKNTFRLTIVSVALAILTAPAFANVKISDIVGSTENGADNEFYKRGFELVDGQQSGEESFKTYYNSETRQCVMAEILDNQVISINPSENANCGQGNDNAKAASSGGVNVSDIVGSTERHGDEKFSQRGFGIVDANQSGEETFKTYFNSATRQCVMAEILDNEVISINPSENAYCR